MTTLDYNQFQAYIDGLYADGEMSEQDYNDIILYILANGETEKKPRDLIQIRRGFEENLPTLAQGELGFTLDTEQLFVGGLNKNKEFPSRDYVDEQLAEIAYVLPQSNGTDDTTDIQAVIDSVSASGGGTILINDTYLINDVGLNPKSNTYLKFGLKGKLQKIATSATWYTVISISNVSNVIIENPTIIGDRETHIGTTGEQGHGIYISSGSRNIKIIQPDISKCWGDGIYIGSAAGSGDIEDIQIIRPKLRYNRRNGISITDGANVLIDEPYITNQDGTAPMSGIDIEPNSPTARLENIKIKGGYYGQNTSSGLVMALAEMRGSENDVSITVDGGEYVDNNLTVYHAPNIKGTIRINKPNILRGKLNLQRCYADSIQIIVDNPRIKDYSLTETISQQYSSGIMIGLTANHTPLGALGGITINNPVVETSRSTAFGGIGIGDYTNTGTTIKDVVINNYRCNGGLSDITLRDDVVFDNVIITPSKEVVRKVNSLTVIRSNVISTVLSAEQSANFNIWTNFGTIPNGLEFTYTNMSTNGFNLRFGENTAHIKLFVGLLSPTTAISGLSTTDLGAKIKLKKISADTIIITEMLGTWSTVE